MQPKNSSGLAVVVFQKSTESLATLNLALAIALIR